MFDFSRIQNYYIACGYTDMRKQIEEALGIKAHDVYGLTEIMGPGVSYECAEQAGMHVCEDFFIPGIIDPDTGAVLGRNGICAAEQAFGGEAVSMAAE